MGLRLEHLEVFGVAGLRSSFRPTGVNSSLRRCVRLGRSLTLTVVRLKLVGFASTRLTRRKKPEKSLGSRLCLNSGYGVFPVD